MTEDRVLINGLLVNYKITEGEKYSLSDRAKRRSPILVLHGWGKGSDPWINFLQSLSSSEYKIIIPDLPGFGKSNNPSISWDLDNYVEWLNDFIKILNLEKVYLLGHSFGGRVAIKFAVKYPEKISKLVLYEAAGIKHPKTFSQSLFFLISKIGNIFSFLPFYSFFQKVFYKFFVRKNDYLQAKGTMKKTFLKTTKEDLAPLLRRISVFTMIIWGNQDEITPMSDAYLMKKEIPHSDLKIVANQGHGFHREHPEELTKVILPIL